MADSYFTIEAPSESKYTEKMSKFLAFAFPVSCVEAAKEKIADLQNAYHDARHVCWAYMIGQKRDTYLSSDNGEPSGTAGKPILGQINSFNLTDIVIVVVRYFGGIKLGTPGLISAYRQAARQAIEEATIIECHSKSRFTAEFQYEHMHEIMKVAKMKEAKILNQTFDNICSITIECNDDDLQMLQNRLADHAFSITIEKQSAN